MKIQSVISNCLNKFIWCLILLSSTLICYSLAQLLVHLSRKAPDGSCGFLGLPSKTVKQHDKFPPLFYSFSVHTAGGLIISSGQTWEKPWCFFSFRRTICQLCTIQVHSCSRISCHINVIPFEIAGSQKKAQKRSQVWEICLINSGIKDT